MSLKKVLALAVALAAVAGYASVAIAQQKLFVYTSM